MAADYVIALRLAGQRCIVVGGGEVAERKVEALLECGGTVAVISPTLRPRLERWVVEGRIHHGGRAFSPSHLEGVGLVIAATDDPEVNRQVAMEAKKKGVLVNVVDAAEAGNFHVPAVLRRGDLTIAISTGGRSPFLAHYLRRELEKQYGPEYAALVALLGELRPLVRQRVPDDRARRQVWARMIESQALDLLRAGNWEAAKECLMACLF